MIQRYDTAVLAREYTAAAFLPSQAASRKIREGLIYMDRFS